MWRGVLTPYRRRRQFVPDDLKDDKYWARRRKNNMAAKRSRDARRMKENQIAMRAGYLEKEVSAQCLQIFDFPEFRSKCSLMKFCYCILVCYILKCNNRFYNLHKIKLKKYIKFLFYFIFIMYSSMIVEHGVAARSGATKERKSHPA